MVRISPGEAAFTNLAASCIIHNGKDGSQKGDWYLKIAAFLIDESLAGMFNARPKALSRALEALLTRLLEIDDLKWEEPVKARFLLQLPRSNEVLLLVPPTS
jgi:hypothetical protein